MPTENAYNTDALLSQSNVYVKLVHMTLFRNKRFVLNKTLQNLLYLIYVFIRKNIFVHFVCNFTFYNLHLILMNALPSGLCWHRPGHLLGKNIKLDEMVNEKKMYGVYYMKYSKFWTFCIEQIFYFWRVTMIHQHTHKHCCALF